MTIDSEERATLDELHNEKVATTGGRRQYGRITIVHGTDQPRRFEDLSLNQVLPEVKFEFARTGQDGKESVYYTANLSHAKVLVFKLREGGLHRELTMEYEKVEFSYQKIMVQWKNGSRIRKSEWT